MYYYYYYYYYYYIYCCYSFYYLYYLYYYLSLDPFSSQLAKHVLRHQLRAQATAAAHRPNLSVNN